MLADLGQMVEIKVNPIDLGPNLSEQIWSNPSRILPKLDQHRLKFGRFWAKLVGVGRRCPNSGEFGPSLAEIGSDLANIKDLGRVRQDLAETQIQQRSVGTLRCMTTPPRLGGMQAAPPILTISPARVLLCTRLSLCKLQKAGEGGHDICVISPKLRSAAPAFGQTLEMISASLELPRRQIRPGLTPEWQSLAKPGPMLAALSQLGSDLIRCGSCFDRRLGG